MLMNQGLYNKLEKWFGRKTVDKWEKGLNLRDAQLLRFLRNKAVTDEVEYFKDKHKLTTEEVLEFYRDSCFNMFQLSGHVPFHTEEFVGVVDIPKNAKILEFGAGLAQDLFNLEKHGYTNLHYYEVSKLAADFVRFAVVEDKSKVRVINELESDYDVIYSFDVLEHIPNYNVVYMDLFRRLKLGGLFINGYHCTPKGEKGRPSHYEEIYNVNDLFTDNGFELANGNHIWRKKAITPEEVRCPIDKGRLKTKDVDHVGVVSELVKEVKRYNGCKVIVEIGVSFAQGASGMLAAAPNAKYYGYDPWPDDEKWHRKEKAHAVLKEYIDRGQVRITDIDSIKITKLPMSDLIHIDGSHTFINCLSDLKLAMQFLNPKGIILVHDMDFWPVIWACSVWYNENKDNWNMTVFDIQHKWAVIWKKG